MNQFSVTSAPIDSQALRVAVLDSGCGAYASFEGRVRDNQDGRTVMLLEYEAYRLLAEKEGARIVSEAEARFDISGAKCVHRSGALQVGDLAVLVGVAAAHRAAAFEACRFIIDEVKKRVPIWKKETYSNGQSEWINCHACGQASNGRPDYSRQISLNEIGEPGQGVLARARVLVVGAGGLGCPALQYLAAAGVGALGIVDHDRIDASNLHRQILYGVKDIGRFKTEVAAEKLHGMNPDLTLTTYAKKLGPDDIEQLFREHDLVLDCTDDFDTKYLISDTAVLTATPVVFSSVYQYEGQLHIYQPSDRSACLRCLWPKPPAAPNCEEAGVLGPVPGVFGTLQALEAIKILVGITSGAEQRLLLMNLLDYSVQRISAPRREACNAVCTMATSLNEWRRNAAPEISFESLDDAVAAGFDVIDIREPGEIAARPLSTDKSREIPLSLLEPGHGSLPVDRQYLIVCVRGVRSRNVAGMLRARGIEACSLVGGAAGLSSAP